MASLRLSIEGQTAYRRERTQCLQPYLFSLGCCKMIKRPLCLRGLAGKAAQMHTDCGRLHMKGCSELHVLSSSAGMHAPAAVAARAPLPGRRLLVVHSDREGVHSAVRTLYVEQGTLSLRAAAQALAD